MGNSTKRLRWIVVVSWVEMLAEFQCFSNQLRVLSVYLIAMRQMKIYKLAIGIFATLLLTILPAVAMAQRAIDPQLARRVRRELVTLPYYGVFDNLSFRVDGSKVTLFGQVTRPTLKSDAENAAKSVEGVERVENQIDVLPVSPNDDRIRIAVYRAIFSRPGLDRYGFMAVPSIHIIVKNGHVALEGVVSNEGDKNQANVVANGVPGVFSVKNNLQIEKR